MNEMLATELVQGSVFVQGTQARKRGPDTHGNVCRDSSGIANPQSG
jgi:hypothetical protein